MGAEPRVTVCVPTIGRLEYLAATRASIEAQTFAEFEVLVLDNASADDGRALLEDWAARDARVRVLRVEPRIPMFENFNRGLLAARGDYVTFCHDDDTVAPELLARQVAFLDAHPRAGFSGSNYDYIDERGQVIEQRRLVRATEVWSGLRYIRALVRSGRNPLTMQSIFYRRAALPAGGIDTRLPIHYGDFVFLMRMAESWDVGLVAESLVQVRRHAAQASSSMTLSRGIALRTEVLGAYVDELAARRPHARGLVAELRAGLALSHRTGLVWGWLSARDPEEARACARGLGSGPLDVALGAVLRGLGAIAPASGARRERLAAAARRLVNRQPLRGRPL